MSEGFNTIGKTYGILGAWVARHATPDPSAPICELYPNILDNGDDGDIDIRWPLAPTASAVG